MTPFPHAHVDRFTIRQRLKAVKNVYEVRVALPGDEEGELVAYVEQKTFALKEDLRFWADEAKTAELFRDQGQAALRSQGAVPRHRRAREPRSESSARRSGARWRARPGASIHRPARRSPGRPSAACSVRCCAG